MILVEAFLRTKTWIILQRFIAVTAQMCFVSGCWLNIHDEVNGSCLEHLGCGSWICTATCGNWGVSRALVSLTNGVSISVTCVTSNHHGWPLLSRNVTLPLEMAQQTVSLQVTVLHAYFSHSPRFFCITNIHPHKSIYTYLHSVRLLGKILRCTLEQQQQQNSEGGPWVSPLASTG